MCDDSPEGCWTESHHGRCVGHSISQMTKALAQVCAFTLRSSNCDNWKWTESTDPTRGLVVVGGNVVLTRKASRCATVWTMHDMCTWLMNHKDHEDEHWSCLRGGFGSLPFEAGTTGRSIRINMVWFFACSEETDWSSLVGAICGC
jgi:hypothetical protein